MIKYSEFRNTMYETQFKRWSQLINWSSPYTYIKSIYYMEFAVIFLFLTQKFIKSPCFVTSLYLVVGITGAFLINSTNIALQLLGIVFVFSKGIFDWADGPLARRLNKTSFIGHCLDVYGASANDVAFRISFVYYSLLQNPDYMYLYPIFTFLLAVTNFKVHTDSKYGANYNANNQNLDKQINNAYKSEEKSLIFKLYSSFSSILDARARSIDSLLLLILVDIFYGFDLTLVFLFISFFMVFKAIVAHIGSFYLVNRIYK